MSKTMKNIHLLFILRLTTAFSPRPTSTSRALFGASSNGFGGASILKHHYRQYHHYQPHRRHVHNNNSMARSDSGEGEVIDSKMKILGVCGGIGSGKSTACQLMVDSLGCVARIDADKLAHVVYEPGSKALGEIITEFGKDILDESDDAQIDRKKLGAIVFSDTKSMSKLERIVWPHVKDKIEERIEEIKHEHQSRATANNIIIVEAALLLETNWHDLLDGLWVIQASQPVATQRLKDNRGLTEEEALVRIRAQDKRRGIGNADCDGGMSDKLSQEMEDGVVTAVITNDGTLEELENALKKTLCDPASFKR